MPPTPCTDPRANAVLAFWFGTGADYGSVRKAWFVKDAAFDAAIRERFLALWESAAAGALGAWQASPGECLAFVVLCDQFPRNMFRGEARSFATDPAARAACLHALERGWDREMLPAERQFLYLPLEHAESLADQERCLALMESIANHPGFEDLPRWAQAHLDIIRRFGRFPHRNAALGRASSPEEIAFLGEPGSSF